MSLASCGLAAYMSLAMPTRRSLRPSLLALALVGGVGACTAGPEAPTCALPDGRVFDIAGRGDGLYGVEGDRVGDTPLASFEGMVRTDDGVDAESGKPWIAVRLSPADAERLHAWSAEPEGKSIAVVADGALASRHKLRATLEGRDFQVSCCDPRACARWRTLLAAGR